MANDVMKKVDELLKLAGLDETVVKSITEKLAVEEVEEAACPIKKEPEDDEHQEVAPVDPKLQDGIKVDEACEKCGKEKC